jgi:hypothetical protein
MNNQAADHTEATSLVSFILGIDSDDIAYWAVVATMKPGTTPKIMHIASACTHPQHVIACLSQGISCVSVHMPTPENTPDDKEWWEE